MHYLIKIGGEVRPVNTPTTIAGAGLPAAGALSVRDSGEYMLPDADRYARRLADEAFTWLAFARERTAIPPDTLTRKALEALAFTLRHRAHGFAVPSRLVGTAAHQRELWELVRAGIRLGERLDVAEEGRALFVSYGGRRLGRVQDKHRPWLAPLLRFGASVHVLRVSGSERSDYRLGLNVAFARVGAAVVALHHALGHNPLGKPLNRSLSTGLNGLAGDGLAGPDLPSPRLA